MANDLHLRVRVFKHLDGLLDAGSQPVADSDFETVRDLRDELGSEPICDLYRYAREWKSNNQPDGGRAA